jgi:polysaccharide biosynthesis transport protein
MLDRASVPRRALDFEDYVSMIRRNFRWIIGPLFAGLVVSTVVAYLWRDTYVSEALIRIVPQQISTEVVPDLTAQDISDRINGMAQQIKSHSTLTTMITSFGLYPKEVKSAPMQDVVEQMKKDIAIKPVEGITNVTGKELPAMQVSFSYRDAITAQKVCSDIVARFVDANIHESLGMQQSAYQFINEQYENASKNLQAIDTKLEEFRKKYAGRLPDEMQANMAQMQALSQRSASVSDALGRNAEQRTVLQSALEMANDRVKAVKSAPQSPQQNLKLSELDKEISNLQTDIGSMKNRYTDNMPDLVTAQERLKLLKKQREEAAKNDDSDENSGGLNKDLLDAQNLVKSYQGQLAANSLEAKRLQKESNNVNGALAAYQNGLQGLPSGQKEYAELMRDHELAKKSYDDLSVQRQKSAAAIKLSDRKQGQSLELLDSPTLPSAPSKPKRYIIIPAGALAGLAIGVIIVALREMKDGSLKSLKDARVYTQLPILGSIPLLENDVVVQRRKQALWVGWAAATLVGLAIMAGSIVHYYIGKA